MAMEREVTCCFTGHRPEKLPWRFDERDPRCLTLKESMKRELEGLYRLGYRHFISGMARGCDLYFTEAALALKEKYPALTVEAAIPCPTQADRWPEAERRRWQELLDRCDLETVVQQNFTPHCMLRRDRYMVERSAAILAVFDGTPGGTQYTLNHAMNCHLDIFLLDLNHPSAPATHLTL